MKTEDIDNVTILGLGAMGRTLAEELLKAGHTTTVWNRSPGRDGELVEQGALVAPSVAAAVTASPVVIACLFDHASVHETLDPIAAELRGRTLINLTTTTPEEARELARWAADAGITYLDGGIMAVPEMIGGPGSAIFYSGSAEAFEQYNALLDVWGESSYFGADAGMASLWDMAILAGMYTMFGGFLLGAAMVGSEGVSAADFASRAGPFLAAMAGTVDEFATVIDGGDYTVAGQQSLEFSDLSDILQAIRDQKVSTEVLEPVQALITRQIAAGHGKEGFARIYEGIRNAAA